MDQLEKVVQELRAFTAEREWEQFHDPKNLAMAVASEAGELLAEYRWISNTEADDYSQKSDRRKHISQEVADVGIALLLFCDRVGLNLVDAFQEKIARNRENYPADRSRGRWQRPT